MRIARVLPNVTGLDKQFDYVVPDSLAVPVGLGEIQVGDLVRVDLHGRRIGGWVTALLDGDDAAVDVSTLKPVAKLSGRGPDASIFPLAEWAAVRWAARRARPMLVAASPGRAITVLPPRRRTAAPTGPKSPATSQLLAGGGGVLRLPPRTDLAPVVRSAVSHGPALVVVPTVADAIRLTRRLRSDGATVALMPDEWAAARAGVDLVIGPRSAAWAPCPDLACAVVLDEHDEALQEERSPTWHARDVMVERCVRLGVPAVLVSPIPTLAALDGPTGAVDVVHPDRSRERAGWPVVTVVDRRDDAPWKKSLVTSPLIERLRVPDSTVVCISNITGRARVLACRTCRSLLRCETCDAAVGMTADERLRCARCTTERPPVCQACGAGRFANLRPGVSRLREELEAAAGRPVAEITARTESPSRSPETPDAPRLIVGTEAALYRTERADVVAFLEFDSEMLAPRFRAAEHALALIVRAGRLAPEVLIQTFAPDHDVVKAARLGDPESIVAAERSRRRLLQLPPYGALAAVSGTGAADVVSQLGPDVDVGGDEANGYLLRTDHWDVLGRALNGAERPKGARLRIEVDPPRI